MKQIGKYIIEKLHINTDLKLPGHELKKGIKIVAKKDDMTDEYIVTDFISCEEDEQKLIKFIEEWDKYRIWYNNIVGAKRKSFYDFDPDEYECLVACKDCRRNNDKTYVFTYGGKNVTLHIDETDK